MPFVKYQHIERFGTDEVDGIENGICYVFPKIDGTNASVWREDEDENGATLHAGSRNRELSESKDNAGFYKAVTRDMHDISAYLYEHPTHRLFGEWLVPHSLKTYKDDAWKKFYIFDVALTKEDGTLEYIPYDIYKPMLDEYNLDYIAPIRIVKNGSFENFVNCTRENTFLIKDGFGVGEGVVIKNYDFYNKYGRQTWAKIVTTEFREEHTKVFGAPISNYYVVEQEIVDKFVTQAFVDKEFEKIKVEKEGWKSQYIPIFLGKVWHELIVEESWNIVKQFKNPTINFKRLNALTIKKVKELKSEVFS